MRLQSPNGGKKVRIGVWYQMDQLSPQSSLLSGVTPFTARICLIDPSPSDLTYRPHKKKLVLILSMIRHFAEELRALGWGVEHYSLDSPRLGEICRLGKATCLEHFMEGASITHLRVMHAAEYDEDRFLEGLSERLAIPVEILPNDRFMVGREAFSKWFEGQNQPTMEQFYEARRKETGLLMEGESPLGGQWNFDAENRAAPEGNLPVPDLPNFSPDSVVQEAVSTVNRFFPDHPGTTDGFALPVQRADVETWVEDFLQNRLRLFGMYQDAMLSKSHVIYHSRLSVYLNHGLIEPMEVLQRADAAHRAGLVPLNSAEGFIRQILGWREYVHGMYWRRMPGYREENPLDFEGEIPEMMRSGETLMKCLKSAVEHSISEGYIHHIERLMIVGNFGLLIGVHPKKLVEWFRETYIDSAEWATVPNVMGLLMAADGDRDQGRESFGSKPYAASAHYIGTMSDYCKGCFYNGKKRLGEKACPFNYLYWNFVGENQDRFKNNPRMKSAVQMHRVKPKTERDLISSSARKFLDKIHRDGTDRFIARTKA